MKKKVKWIATAVLALAAAGAGVMAAMAPISAGIVTITPQKASVTFTESAVYAYDSSYTLYPLVSGEVLEVRVKAGDIVRAGDVLAVVDAVDYREQIEQLAASVAGFNAQIANLGLQDQQLRDSYLTQYAALRGQLATLRQERAKSGKDSESLKAQIQIQEEAVDLSREAARNAREDWRDARDLGDDLLVSQTRQSYDAARNAASQSELLLEQLKAGGVPEELFDAQEEAIRMQAEAMYGQMEKSYTGGLRQYYNAQIEAANLTISQLEARAGRAEIRAAVAGTIEHLPIKDQNVITQQQPAAVISSSPFVEVFVPVREIDSITVGMSAELILDKRLGEEIITGSVVEIEDEAEIKLSPLGVQERKVRVLIRPDEDRLQIGYSADARFTVWEQENALTAPKTAVFSADGGDFVWTVHGDRLSRAPVEKGVELRDSYVILSGLFEGDVVILDANNEALAEGRAFRIA